jgi:hypothetical protein
MAHFAKIENGLVVEVNVISNSDLDDDGEFPDSEKSGQDFQESLGLSGTWLQTSYNGNFRKNYAGIGYTYDEDRDAFIPPKPYDSWVLNEETCLWDAPIPYPEDGETYTWDEEQGDWTQITNETE